MAATAELFKEGMRKLGGGVTIVATAHDDTPAGLTATAVCSLSAEPPRLLACINRSGTTYSLVSSSRIFCVNILSAAHQDLAACFAGWGGAAPQDRFKRGQWAHNASGTPFLKDALASFDCCVSSIIDTGSHAIIIGDIKGIRVQPGAEPLLYMDGRFSTLCPLAAE
jgi:flavin reductase (DIM6/NTAB) family NADH-FMN oxidoreductase RutF